MKTQTKAKKGRRQLDKTSEFFLKLGLLTYSDRSRFLPDAENIQKEKSPTYIPRLSGSSQPFCLNEY